MYAHTSHITHLGMVQYNITAEFLAKKRGIVMTGLNDTVLKSPIAVYAPFGA